MSITEKKRGRPKGTNNQLNTQAIMDMAKALMQEDGKIPSIRKLASHLNIDAMAIYYYFSNKNKLLEAITTSLIDDIYKPKVSQNWKLELYKLSTSYLTLLDNYPGLLETLLGMSSNSPAVVFSERFYVVIQPLQLDENSTNNALNLLVDYLHGYALAINCNNTDAILDVDMIKGSLELYCIALENAQ